MLFRSLLCLIHFHLQIVPNLAEHGPEPGEPEALSSLTPTPCNTPDSIVLEMNTPMQSISALTKPHTKMC